VETIFDAAYQVMSEVNPAKYPELFWDILLKFHFLSFKKAWIVVFVKK
jgi:hypothetical protein